MRVEREIAVFAFPFAAGVIAAVILGASPCIIKPTYPTMALTVTFLSAGLLLSASSRKCGRLFQWSVVTLCAIACGAFIGMCGIEMEISAIESEGVLTGWARAAGQKMQGVIDRIPFENSTTNGVLKALLTGNRSGLNTEVIQAFRDSGASHILALSGLHLGIIYLIVSKTLALCGNSHMARRTRSVIIILICGLYTLATGAGASITRAYIFIILKEIAEMTGRFASLKCILAASLLIHLTFDPSSAKDVGFQLSYAAMFGIAYIFPYMRKMWTNDLKILKWIWESAALSISCQLTTGPLVWYYFGTFPQYFLLTNLLALPLTGILIPIALLTITMTAVGWCPDIVIYVTEYLAQSMIEALSIIASM